MSALNDWCKGVELILGEYTGCTCDCPACEAAYVENKKLSAIIVKLEVDTIRMNWLDEHKEHTRPGAGLYVASVDVDHDRKPSIRQAIDIAMEASEK